MVFDLMTKITFFYQVELTFTEKGKIKLEQSIKPIFHQKLKLHCVAMRGKLDKQHEINMPNANPKQKCNHIPLACVGARIELFCSTLPVLCPTQGSTADFRVCVWSARLFRYKHLGIGNAKISCWRLCPMQGPNLRGYAFW